MQDRRGAYGMLAGWVLGHRRLVALVAALITALAALGSSRLGVDSNILSLLPDDDPAAQAIRRLNLEEGGVNVLTLAFEAEDPARIDPFLDDLVVRLDALPEVDFAIHEVDPDLAYRIGLLQLSPSETAELTLRLRGALLLGPALNPIVTQRLMDMGPLTQRIARAGDQSLFGDVGAGKGRVLVRPTGPSSDPIFAKRLMDEVDRVLAEADPAAHGLRVAWIGGAYRHVNEDREGIRRDILVTGFASAGLVLLVIAIAFRSLRATVLVYVPLVAANIVALATVWLMFGTINTYTSFAIAILLGLGTDFAMHLVGRYREERTKGKELEPAIIRAWDKAGPPCTTAALTGAAGFLALATARFEGFSQLGVALAAGLIICLVFVLFVLPVLIPALDRNPPPTLGLRERPDRRPATYRLAPIGLMIAVLATGVAATRIDDLEWEFDISALRSDGLAYDELSPEEQKLARESYAPVVVSYPDREALAADQKRIERLIADGELPHIARAVSIETVLPADQDARIVQLRQLKGLLDNPNLRYLPPPIVKNLLALREWDGMPLAEQDLPQSVRELVGADGEHHRILLFPKGNMWDLREAAALADEIEEQLPGRDVAGEYVAMGSLYEIVHRDMPIISLLSLALCTVLAAIDLRRLSWVVVAIGTLLAGVAWAAVAVEAVGVKLSILNIVGLPILFGISVDVCVHLLHRLSEEGPGGVRRALRTTGVASFVSTLTSILAFGTLLLGSNRGVRSLGLLVALGLAIEFAVTAMLMPLAWSAGWRVTGRAPGDHRRRHRSHHAHHGHSGHGHEGTSHKPAPPREPPAE